MIDGACITDKITGANSVGAIAIRQQAKKHKKYMPHPFHMQHSDS